MPLTSFDGGWNAFLGPNVRTAAVPASGTTTIDAVNEAIIFVGQVITTDGASHTIDTSGSSSIGWRTTTVTLNDGGTVVKVGIAPVSTAAGPPARADHTSDVINFDVAAVFTGGGGGITANAWQTSVPTTGTKTIANGDFVAIAVQMTARGATDTLQVLAVNCNVNAHKPVSTTFTGGIYSALTRSPNALITFSDGTLGWIYGSEIASAVTSRAFGTSSGNVEYGQLYKIPFPMRLYGLYGWVDPNASFDVVLYSDPLGTPSAERTISNTAASMASTNGSDYQALFSTPYDTTADQEIAVVIKPTTATTISAYYRTLDNAAHRITCINGTDSYGIARASGGGAFAAENSNLDQYYIGLLVGGFHDGTGGAGGGLLRHPGMAGGCSA